MFVARKRCHTGCVESKGFGGGGNLNTHCRIVEVSDAEEGRASASEEFAEMVSWTERELSTRVVPCGPLRHRGDQFRCSTCFSLFVSRRLLDIHIAENHDALFPHLAIRKNMYECFVYGCVHRFPGEKERNEHLKSVHRIDLSRVSMHGKLRLWWRRRPSMRDNSHDENQVRQASAQRKRGSNRRAAQTRFILSPAKSPLAPKTMSSYQFESEKQFDDVAESCAFSFLDHLSDSSENSVCSSDSSSSQLHEDVPPSVGPPPLPVRWADMKPRSVRLRHRLGVR